MRTLYKALRAVMHMLASADCFFGEVSRLLLFSNFVTSCDSKETTGADFEHDDN